MTAEQLKAVVESMLLIERPMKSRLPRTPLPEKKADRQLQRFAAIATKARALWVQAQIAEAEANKTKRMVFDLQLEIEEAIRDRHNELDNPPIYEAVDEHESGGFGA